VKWHIKRLWWFVEIYWRCKFGNRYRDTPSDKEYGLDFAWYWSGRRAAISKDVEQMAKPKIWVRRGVR